MRYVNTPFILHERRNCNNAWQMYSMKFHNLISSPLRWLNSYVRRHKFKYTETAFADTINDNYFIYFIREYCRHEGFSIYDFYRHVGQVAQNWKRRPLIKQLDKLVIDVRNYFSEHFVPCHKPAVRAHSSDQ